MEDNPQFDVTIRGGWERKIGQLIILQAKKQQQQQKKHTTILD